MYFFFRKLYWLWLIGNRTSCCAILSVIILVINESDSRFTVVRFCWSLVWLQTELDSIQSYYHYLSCNALEWMIMTMKKNKQSIYLVRGLAKHFSTKSKFGLKRNSCGNSTQATKSWPPFLWNTNPSFCLWETQCKCGYMHILEIFSVWMLHDQLHFFLSPILIHGIAKQPALLQPRREVS